MNNLSGTYFRIFNLVTQIKAVWLTNVGSVDMYQTQDQICLFKSSNILKYVIYIKFLFPLLGLSVPNMSVLVNTCSSHQITMLKLLSLLLSIAQYLR